VHAAGITVFSSYYALYNEFSLRMHAILQRYGTTDPFSVDEAFLGLTPIPARERLVAMRELRAAILREITIPVTFGVAATKC
jgi:DNA polymerase V